MTARLLASPEHRTATPRHTAFVIGSFIATVALAMSSTGCTPTLLEHLNTHEEITYKNDCKKATDKHSSDLAGGRYFLPEFHVEKWIGEKPKSEKIGEKELVDQIVSGKTRTGMVIARGGLGKSRLAKSIRAQTCSTVPIFSLDLNKDVAAYDVQGTDAMLLMMLARKLHIGGGQDGLAELDRLLRSQRWILLADAIEEVDLIKRAKVALAIAKLRNRYPNTLQIIIFARPPLLVPYYGFGLMDTVVHILPITCQRAEKFVGKLSKNQSEESRFWAFAKDYGFDAKGKFGYQCLYPYMATYRDVLVLRKLALGAGKKFTIESYSDAHEHLVGDRLRKELAKLGWSRREALDMIDRMVRYHAEKEGPGKLIISIDNCKKSIDPDYGWTAVDAGVKGSSEQRRRQVCEKALQSVLFTQNSNKIGDSGTWAFADPLTEQLFQARWLNGELARSGAGDCTVIDKHLDLLRNAKIVRFMVGQRLVQRCFPQTLRALCGRKDAKADHLEDVIKGLPRGQKRQLIVEQARAWEAEKGNDKCALESLEVINKTVGN